jgi:hypothetical protein
MTAEFLAMGAAFTVKLGFVSLPLVAESSA